MTHALRDDLDVCVIWTTGRPAWCAISGNIAASYDFLS
jgi:hypothetical protein